MRIDEQIDSDGKTVVTVLRRTGDLFEICTGDVMQGAIPANAISVVMRRYGKPVADGVEPNGDSIELPGGARLSQLRFRAIVDADVRDYLVLSEPGCEPVAAIATHVSAALRHLCRSGS